MASSYIGLQQADLDKIIQAINNRAKLSDLANAGSTKYTFTATDGQTSFTTTGTTLIAAPAVYLNGALQQITNTYTVSGLVVTFVEARVANDSIVIIG